MIKYPGPWHEKYLVFSYPRLRPQTKIDWTSAGACALSRSLSAGPTVMSLMPATITDLFKKASQAQSTQLAFSEVTLQPFFFNSQPNI